MEGDGRPLDDVLPALVDVLPAIVVILDGAGKIAYLSPFMEELSGRPLADNLGRDWFSAFLPEGDRDPVRALFASVPDGADIDGHIQAIVTASGETREIEWYCRAVRGAAGTWTGLACVGKDVTEARRAEEELRTHSLVLMSMGEGVLFIDRDEIIRFTNPALDAMFGYGEGELVGRHVGILNGASEVENLENSARVRAAVAENGAWQGEFRNRRKDGTVFYTRARITMLERPGEVMFVSVQRDITEEKRAEEELRASLREKETLLREVHHRVKNNLQIISSLLHFQAKRVRNPADLSAFEDGRNRLLAMILVHEKLYQAEHLSRIELPGYLRSLVGALAESFERDHPIAIEVCVDPIELPVELALPTGMLVCELVTNIFKYAFPDDRPGSAAVKVTRSGDDVVIDVSDRGVGFPSGFDAATESSFGWQLVRTLALQLDGSVETATDGGARVTVTFPAQADETL